MEIVHTLIDFIGAILAVVLVFSPFIVMWQGLKFVNRKIKSLFGNK